MRVTRLKALSLLGLLILTVAWAPQPALAQEDPDLDVPYVPTPPEVVDRMLEMANVGPGDYVMDLGSGDGRIVIAAVQKGAFGHGVDLDPKRVREARENAEEEKVTDRVLFLQQDLFETEIREASVITMYLLPSVNEELRPRLLEDLRPGTRVVSHQFDMNGWEPDESVTVEKEAPTSHSIYLWIIPADAAGTWSVDAAGRSFQLHIDQQFQKLDLTLESGGQRLAVQEPELRGRRLAFTAEGREARYVFSGRVEDGRISGTVQIRDGDTTRVETWQAERDEDN